jgi:hypothetical protein
MASGAGILVTDLQSGSDTIQLKVFGVLRSLLAEAFALSFVPEFGVCCSLLLGGCAWQDEHTLLDESV